MAREFRPLTTEEKLFLTISRGNICPLCGKLHIIGTEEERNAWECIADTPQGVYIAQCIDCGGLIEVRANNDPRDLDKGEKNVKTEPKKCDTSNRGCEKGAPARARLFGGPKTKH